MLAAGGSGGVEAGSGSGCGGSGVDCGWKWWC